MLFNKNNKDTEDLLADPSEQDLLPEDLKLKIKEHALLCDYIHNLYVTKNRDYGDSMHPLYQEYGLTAFLIMFSIKLSRIKSLMQKGSATYESLEDSLVDLANYALIATVELRYEKNGLKYDDNLNNIIENMVDKEDKE